MIVIMISSSQTSQQIKKKKLIPPATGWNCPMCGQKALIRVTSSIRLEEDGVIMPVLDRLQCRSCKDDLFDLYAMGQIAEFRKRHPYKKPMARRHNVDKNAVAA